MNALERLAWQRGLRVRPKQRTILQILDEATEPLSARDIYARTLPLGQYMSQATVYRTLKRLLVSKLVTAIASTNRTPRYTKASAPHAEHLVDVRTGRIREFRSEQIAARLQEAAHQLGYRLLDYRLELFGAAVCAADARRAATRWPGSLQSTAPAPNARAPGARTGISAPHRRHLRPSH